MQNWLYHDIEVFLWSCSLRGDERSHAVSCGYITHVARCSLCCFLRTRSSRSQINPALLSQRATQFSLRCEYAPTFNQTSTHGQGYRRRRPQRRRPHADIAQAAFLASSSHSGTGRSPARQEVWAGCSPNQGCPPRGGRGVAHRPACKQRCRHRWRRRSCWAGCGSAARCSARWLRRCRLFGSYPG